MKIFITANYIILFFLHSQLFAHARSQDTYYDRVEIEKLFSNIEQALKWCVDPQELSATKGRLFARDLMPIHNDSNLNLNDAIKMFQHMLSHDMVWALTYSSKYPDQKIKTNFTKSETCQFLKKLSLKYSKILATM